MHVEDECTLRLCRVFVCSAGADVNLRDPTGKTALTFACEQRKQDLESSSTSMERRMEVARSLLAAGAHVDARDIAGQSSLMNACSALYAPLVRLLLDSGADVMLRHGKGATAVGVLAGWLSSVEHEATALELIEACVAKAPNEAAASRLREEVHLRQCRHAGQRRTRLSVCCSRCAGQGAAVLLFHGVVACDAQQVHVDARCARRLARGGTCG
jgi:hypothetical protein